MLTNYKINELDIRLRLRLVLNLQSARYRFGLERRETLRLHVKASIYSFFSEFVLSAPDDSEEAGDAPIGLPADCFIIIK